MVLPLRLCSWSTSSSCKSSMRLRSLTRASSGCEKISDILVFARGRLSSCRASSRLAVDSLSAASHRLRQIEFLQFRMNRRRILRFHDHFLPGNQPLLIFVEEKTVQRHHPVLRAGLDIRIDAECFVVTDQRADRGSVYHDFERGDPAGLVDPWQKQLRNDCLQYGGELNPDLLLLVRR